jgi:hypothetical protein
MNTSKSLDGLVAELNLPAETAGDCDRIINPLLILLREGKTDEACGQLQMIDDDIVHTVGRRTCERWVAYEQTRFAVGMLSLAAVTYGSLETSENIQRNHTDEKTLLLQLEGMFMREYSRRNEERRRKREA